jgi:hypothetical protein
LALAVEKVGRVRLYKVLAMRVGERPGGPHGSTLRVGHGLSPAVGRAARRCRACERRRHCRRAGGLSRRLQPHRRGGVGASRRAVRVVWR